MDNRSNVSTEPRSRPAIVVQWCVNLQLRTPNHNSFSLSWRFETPMVPRRSDNAAHVGYTFSRHHLHRSLVAGKSPATALGVYGVPFWLLGDLGFSCWRKTCLQSIELSSLTIFAFLNLKSPSRIRNKASVDIHEFVSRSLQPSWQICRRSW
jgi:hypothetical protein